MAVRNTLAVRQRAPTQDLSLIRDDQYDMDPYDPIVQAKLGLNGSLRAGLATELELGLPKAQWVLVPILPGETASPDAVHNMAVISEKVYRVVDNHNQPIGGVGFTNADARQVLDGIRNYNAALAQVQKLNSAGKLRHARRVAARLIAEETRTPEQTEIANEADFVEAPIPAYADFVPRSYALNSDNFGNFFDDLSEEAADSTLSILTATSIRMNYLQFRATFGNNESEDGLYRWAAHAVTWAWRAGLLEGGAGREFVPVEVHIDAIKGVRIGAIHADYEARHLDQRVIRTGMYIDKVHLKMNSLLWEAGGGTVFASGLNHYQLNHTTGGNIVTGSVAVALASNNLFKVKYGRDFTIRDPEVGATMTKQTSIIYNALHPVNKRGVAAIGIDGSHVVSFRKPAICPTPRSVDLDSFVRMRVKATPAGSHKVFVGETVFQRVLRSGLAMFLPWYDQIDVVGDIICNFKVAGARVHPGARYYTDAPQVGSQQELDPYMPDLAFYANLRMKNSSILFSPHISPSVAAGAAESWRSFLDQITVKGIAAVTDEQWASISATLGFGAVAVNINDPTSIRVSAQRQLALIDKMRNA